jgi:hypothetical protein
MCTCFQLLAPSRIDGEFRSMYRNRSDRSFSLALSARERAPRCHLGHRAGHEAQLVNFRLCSDRSVATFFFSFLSTGNSLVRNAMSASHHGESQAQGWGCPTDLLQLRKFVEEAREIWYSKNPIVSPGFLERTLDSTVLTFEHTGRSRWI